MRSAATAARCLIALPVVMLLALPEWRRCGGLSRREVLAAVCCGALFAGDMLLWTQAIPEVGAGLSTVLVNAQVALVPVLSWLVDRERISRRFVLALPALLVGLAVRPRWLRRQSYLIYAVCLALLVAVLVVGGVRNGAGRWISLPIVSFDLQPSELAKVGVILALARMLYRNRLQRLKDWGPPLLLALVPMALVAKQPDLGTAMTMVPVTLGMLYLAGARAKVIVSFVLGVLLVGVCLWQLQIGVRDYQLQRIDTWMKGFGAQELIEAKSGPAFHSYHARVAIGNGSMLGRGIGKGIRHDDHSPVPPRPVGSRCGHPGHHRAGRAAAAVGRVVPGRG